MALVVCKFGGSSVADAASIRRVARRVVYLQQAGNQVVVVVSAMGDTTDELLDLAAQVSPKEPPTPRELDILLSSGERISMALLAMAIGDLGYRAQAFTGPQAGLLTDNSYGDARITEVQPERISQSLAGGNVAIVAGFQGFHPDSFDTTTLGRGGSDTTAVALAHALDASVCEIYTDVDGVFTADPRVVPAARPIQSITYEEMLELAAHGAKILHLRAVEYARRHGVKLHVRSSFSTIPGTIVADQEGTEMEQSVITGLATDQSRAKITAVGVPDRPGIAAEMFEAIAAAGINVDMVVQNVSVTGTGKTDISFTINQGEVARLQPVLAELQRTMGFANVQFNEAIGTISVVGAGVRSNPGVAARVFGALRDEGINIDMISASEVRISVVIDSADLQAAAQAIHRAFELDREGGEAIIYAGTGR
ncbi:aspartate kinase [Scrofimicrobium sp. R131]|uniref:Aspartokinase n=1 Tax=Scrofimicrobium appendicitidis TaxID=3079930 RepID=A0AAU7V540_9ACTO